MVSPYSSILVLLLTNRVPLKVFGHNNNIPSPHHQPEHPSSVFAIFPCPVTNFYLVVLCKECPIWHVTRIRSGVPHIAHSARDSMADPRNDYLLTSLLTNLLTKPFQFDDLIVVLAIQVDVTAPLNTSLLDLPSRLRAVVDCVRGRTLLNHLRPSSLTGRN